MIFKITIFSDLTIQLEGGRQLYGHRFVLAARSDHWGVDDLSKVSDLDFSGKSTGESETSLSASFLICT